MPFPSSTPSYPGFTSNHTLSQDQHASQHNSEQADIIALANKVGTGASTPTSGLFLRGNGVGTSTWDSVHAATDITGVLPTANYDTIGMLKLVYPVGCIYTETTGVNPGTTFGFGTWTATGQGRVLVGNGSSDQAFAAGATGGESNHVLSSNEMPSHTHTVTDPGHVHVIDKAGTAGGDGSGLAFSSTSVSNSTGVHNTTTGVTNQNTGGGASHNNLQPYLVVYFWQRTA